MQINILSSAIVTAYLLGCGSLYLWGFWLHFNLNILQFVEISDIAKATLLPMLTSLFVFFFHCGMSHINDPTSNNSKMLREAGGRYKYFVYLQFGFFALMLGSGLFDLGRRFLYGTKADKYLCIGVVVTVVLFFLIYKSKFLLDIGKHRAFILCIICTLPSIFMNKGISDAKDILSGKNTFLVESNVSCSPQKEQKFRYIATLSNNGFAYSPSDNSLCVFKYEYMKLSKEPPIPEKTIGWLNRANQAIVEFFGG